MLLGCEDVEWSEDDAQRVYSKADQIKGSKTFSLHLKRSQKLVFKNQEVGDVDCRECQGSVGSVASRLEVQVGQYQQDQGRQEANLLK